MRSGTTTFLSAAVLVFLSTLLLGAGAGPAGASGFGLRSDLREIHSVQPGETVTGEIVVQGYSEEPATVRISQRDYATSPGRSHFREPGEIERSNAGWIRFNPSQVTVERGQRETVTYTVHVPENPELSGSYWSLIMLEPAGQATTRTADSAENIQMRTETRYAVTVVTNVGGSGRAELEIGEINVHPTPDASGAPRLAVNVFNNGSLLRKVKPELRLFRASGERIGQFTNRRFGVYPGSGERIPIGIDRIDPGEYSAVLVLEAETDRETVGARFGFTVEPEENSGGGSNAGGSSQKEETDGDTEEEAESGDQPEESEAPDESADGGAGSE